MEAKPFCLSIKDLIIVSLCIGIIHVSGDTFPEILHHQYACYGNIRRITFNDANCSSNQIIAPFDVKVGSKPRHSGCPEELPYPGYSTVDFDACCKPKENDTCFGNLALDQSHPFHTRCVGRAQCRPSNAARIATYVLGCDSSIYYANTHFFVMDYYCINEDKIGIFSTTNLTNNGDGSAVYLLGQTYPSEINISHSACLVYTDYGNSISIYAMDIRFKSNNGVCQQTMTIADDTTTRTIDCDDNNFFNISVIYTSQSNNLTLQFANNFGLGGYFWLGFVATSTGNLTLKCPVEITPSQTTTDETITAQGKLSTLTTTTINGITASVHSTTKANLGVIIGAVMALLLLIVLVIVIIIIMYQKKMKRAAEEADLNGDQNPIIEDSSCEKQPPSTKANDELNGNLNNRPGHLPPIGTAFTSAENDRNKNSESKRKKKKKKKRKTIVEPEPESNTNDENN